MANKNYDVLNDVKKQKNNDFLTNLSKERTRQNTALSMSNSSSSETIKTTPAVTDTYKANRYEVEKQTPSNDTKALQTSLNDFGYVGKDNKPLKVDGAYGPNTDHAFNTAWKNNEQVIKNNELAKARDKVAEAINNAYEPLMDDAETRKWNMSKADIEKTQNLLNDFGYTDWQGNKLKMDGILGPKTRGALEKHIQDGTPKQEVLDMQKLYNEMGITDKDDNPLTPDGKLGVKTDSATHKAVKKYGNVTEQEPVRGDAEKSAQQTDSFKQAVNTVRNITKTPQETKQASYYDYTQKSDDVITNKQLEQLSETNTDTIGNNMQSLFGNNIKTKDEIAKAFNINSATLGTDFNETVEKLASNTFSADDSLNSKVTEAYENYKAPEEYKAELLSVKNILPKNNKKYETPQDFMPDSVVKLAESQKNINNYPNNTVHLNDYFWKREYKTDDIKGVQKVLGNLAVDGDIGANTSAAIANYAKANNLTLEQASDKLVELGRMYNEVEKMGFESNEIEQLQSKLNQLGITGDDGKTLAQDNLLGKNTLSAIKELSQRYEISTKDTINILLDKSQNYPEEINVLSESFTNVCTDAENAYKLEIITEAEKDIVIKDAIQEQLDIKSKYIKCKDDIIENNKFIDSLEKILEFGIFSILLGDIDSGTAYSPSEADYVRQKMYGNEDNYIKIFIAGLAHQSGYKGTNVGNVVKINGDFWRVDIEYPQGNKPGNLHVQLKDKNIHGTTSPRKMIKTLDDLDELPKAVRKNPAIRKAVERGLKTLGKMIL